MRITVLEPDDLAARAKDLRTIAMTAFTAPPWNETHTRAALAASRLVSDSIHENGHVAALALIDERPCGSPWIRSRQWSVDEAGTPGESLPPTTTSPPHDQLTLSGIEP